MILAWWRRWRRKRILAAGFPDAWLAIVERNVVVYQRLSASEQARLRDDLQVFVATKHWEGCAGLALTEEMKVTVAALACYMALGLEADVFRGVLSILMYPAGYAAPEDRGRGGLVIRGRSARLGESWYRGPVILSWGEVLHDGQHPGEGRNLVWHEFAHQLDMLDRSIDGTPPLPSREMYASWREVMTAEFNQLRADSRAGRDTLLDPYGAKDAAEFFAVASECFFDLGPEMRAEHPRMYELLAKYYRQDPAEREEFKPSPFPPHPEGTRG